MRQLLTNLNTHVVTRVSRLNEEKRSSETNGSLVSTSVNIDRLRFAHPKVHLVATQLVLAIVKMGA